MVLAAHGAISVELAAAMDRAVQLRNRLAHGYGTVDTERFYAELPDGLASFEAYGRAIGRYVLAAGD